MHFHRTGMRRVSRQRTAPKYRSCEVFLRDESTSGHISQSFHIFSFYGSREFVIRFDFPLFFFCAIHLSTCWPSTTAAAAANKSVRIKHMQANGLRCWIINLQVFDILSINGVHAFASHTPLSTIHTIRPKRNIPTCIRTTIDNVSMRLLWGAYHGGRIEQCVGQWF